MNVAMVDPKNATAWYDFIKRFIADLRGPAFAVREARAENTKQIFTEVSAIHTDYVTMLSAFRDALLRNPDTGLQAAKDAFLSQREQFSARRMETRIIIDALQTHADLPKAEAAFPRASFGYLVLNEDPFGLEGSMSGLIWLQMKTEERPERLSAMLEHMSVSLSDAFSKVVAALLGVDKRYQAVVMRVQKETP